MLPIQPIYLKSGPNWPDRQCCLAGFSKTAPRILIFFSIAIGADYSFEVKNIEIWAPVFFKHNNSSDHRAESIGEQTNLVPNIIYIF